MAARPPGPVGEFQGQLNLAAFRAGMFGFLGDLASRYGDVVAFDLGHSPCILVNGAPEVRALLLEHEAHLRKPEFVKASNRGWWGDGLTTLEGAEWQVRRRTLRPAFGGRMAPDRLGLAARLTEEMLDRWAPQTEADLLHEVRMLAARLALRTVLDAELEGFGPAEGRSATVPVDEAYGEDFAFEPGERASPWPALVRPRAPQRMDTVLRIVDERIASGEDRGDVLSGLVRTPAGQRLEREAIIGEVIQMLYAGHLTTPLVMLNFWRDVAVNGYSAAIAEEAASLRPAEVPGPSVLARSLCLAALKESMRLHPPAPVLFREVDAGFEIAAHAFPIDVAVWVCPLLLHRDQRYFPDPHAFAPQRFRDGRLPAAALSVYLPFGAGPRTCISQNVVLHQMAVMALLTARRADLGSIFRGDPAPSGPAVPPGA